MPPTNREARLKNGLILDSGLLLLYSVGLSGSQNIQRVKRTREYSADDFLLLSSIVNQADRLLLTPQILAEYSNMSIDYGKSISESVLDKLIQTVSEAIEIWVEKDILLENSAVKRLGLSDASIIELAKKERAHVISPDAKLCIELLRQDCDVYNFNHIRSNGWQQP